MKGKPKQNLRAGLAAWEEPLSVLWESWGCSALENSDLQNGVKTTALPSITLCLLVFSGDFGDLRRGWGLELLCRWLRIPWRGQCGPQCCSPLLLCLSPLLSSVLVRSPAAPKTSNSLACTRCPITPPGASFFPHFMMPVSVLFSFQETCPYLESPAGASMFH